MHQLKTLQTILKRILNWESWPFKILYAPLTPVWLWYIIKSRAMWFFTPSNPKITFGGLDGEPKKEMYDLLPDDSYPKTFYINPDAGFESLLQKLDESGISYPLVVKPEVGCQGILFRKIDVEEEWQHYHDKVTVDYLVQEMVHYPMEVSVFYIRHPKSEKGMVTGFLHKIPLYVEGNGIDTLAQLVLKHPKGQKRTGELQSKHKEHWEQVLPEGQKYVLSHAANHNRGAHFIDLKDEIDGTLVSIFDKISHSINDFFYGRYDIMCTNVEDLKAGKNYAILEYNGCGAEPNHFYDTGYTLAGAYKEILKHWKALYEICKYNRSIGIEPWPFKKGWDFLQATNRHFTNIRQLDKEI